MIGSILSERYKIIERIGIGGMAYVYKAEDILLKRLVAVKVLKEHFVEDSDFSKKFEIEAQSAARLSHPNIVNIYDVGKCEVNGLVVHYIVMEYINGKTLKEIIEEKGTLSNDEVINYAKQIAKALECAHRNDIIHRDIKPQNILITVDNIVKVTDFGIARISSSATITYTSSILGTVHYISPEQAKGKYIDSKSDIYSLGIVIYEMLVGKVPFDAENSVGIALKHIQEPLTPPKELNSDVSPFLNRLVIKCLEKDPEMRYHSAGQLIYAINNQNEEADPTQNDQNTSKMKKTKTDVEAAVYRSPNHSQSNENNKPPKKRSFFLSTVLPIFLALLVVSAGFFVIQNFNKEKEVVEIDVPELTNRSEAEALFILNDNNLLHRIKRAPDDQVQEGHIVSQLPIAGTKIREGEVVEIVISEGPKKVIVPDLTDRQESEVEKIITDSGLQLDSLRYEFNTSIPKNHVITQVPLAGNEVNANSKVTVTISKGSEVKTVEMVNLIGETETNAFKKLRQKNLELGQVDKVYSDVYEQGVVIWQLYDPGVSIEEGTLIDIMVSKGKENVPPVVETPVDPDKKVNYKIEILPPDHAEESLVTIFQVKDGVEIEVYRKIHKASEGTKVVELQAEENAKFNVYYDGTLAKKAD